MTTTPTVWRAQHQVNLTDAATQTQAALVDIGAGRYIVVWTELGGGPIGSSVGDDLIGQIFDSLGNRIGPEFQVNSDFLHPDPNNQQFPALDTRPGGGFVVAYSDFNSAGTSIRAEARDVNGALVGTPTTIQAASVDGDRFSNPSVAVRSDGSYLVAYNREVASDGTEDVAAHIVSAAGVVGAEFPIFDSADVARNPDVDVLTNGNYVVVFEDADDATLADFDPQFRIFTSTGAFVTSNTIDTGSQLQGDVHVAALTGGGFVAVWTEDGGREGMHARILNNNGVSQGAAFTVNTFTGLLDSQPDVTALNDGGFVVVWADRLDAVRGQRFDAAGHKVGAEFSAGSQGEEVQPVVATLSDGRFVVGFNQNEGERDVWATIWSPLYQASTADCDFNGDGITDVLWKNTSTGTTSDWLMAAAGGRGANPGTPGAAGWDVVAAGDFNGNGTTDILWRNTATGETSDWLMAGNLASNPRTPGAAGWNVAATGDFNADGTTDILWQNASTGATSDWLMAGGLDSNPGTPGAAGWSVVATGDFNRDGTTDILWQNASTGATSEWLMSGGLASNPGTPAAARSDVVATGDFNGDGTTDILWKNVSNGATSEWLMSAGGGVASNVGMPGTAGWSLVATGDFNADGTADLLWQNASSGATSEWLMSAGGGLGSNPFTPGAAGWELACSGDFNGDGTVDLMWKNISSGTTSEWLMSAAGGLGSNPFTPGAAGWGVVATGDFNPDGTTDILWQNASTGGTSEWLMSAAGGLGSNPGTPLLMQQDLLTV